jgi:hypothetical protein
VDVLLKKKTTNKFNERNLGSIRIKRSVSRGHNKVKNSRKIVVVNEVKVKMIGKNIGDSCMKKMRFDRMNKTNKFSINLLSKRG